jgi:hypothetical protein
MEGRVELFMHTGGRTRANEQVTIASSHDTRALVYEGDPARATTQSESRITLYWPQRTIDTCARGQIESTESDFHVTIQLDVTMDGIPYCNRRWVRTIPRHLL